LRERKSGATTDNLIRNELRGENLGELKSSSLACVVRRTSDMSLHRVGADGGGDDHSRGFGLAEEGEEAD
jgi:hypothetical protein